jgi:hypothetical protein
MKKINIQHKFSVSSFPHHDLDASGLGSGEASSIQTPTLALQSILPGIHPTLNNHPGTRGQYIALVS